MGPKWMHNAVCYPVVCKHSYGRKAAATPPPPGHPALPSGLSEAQLGQHILDIHSQRLP